MRLHHAGTTPATPVAFETWAMQLDLAEDHRRRRRRSRRCGTTSNSPPPASTIACGEADELVGGGEGAGHQLAVERPCGSATATSRTRPRRPRSRRARGAAISAMSSAVASSLRAPRSPITYTRSGAWGRKAAMSIAYSRRAERVEVLGERLPLPLDALVQRGAGDVLDALHQLDEPVLLAGPHRGEADAAVADHDGGDAVAAPTGRAPGPRWPGRRSACGCRRSRA